MKPTPPGWPRISMSLYYLDPAQAIDWLRRPFGLELRLEVEGEAARIEHCELTYGDGVVMLGSPLDKAETFPYMRSPRQLDGANTQSMMVYVDDVEAHCARARVAGATIVKEPTTTDYGPDYWTDRGYECVDPEGHHWWFLSAAAQPGG